MLDLSELLFQFQKPFPAVSRMRGSTSRDIKLIEMIGFSPSFKSLILERRGFDAVLTGDYPPTVFPIPASDERVLHFPNQVIVFAG